MTRKAPFVTVEGVDGAGKSSHLGTMVAALEAAGFEVVSTREPGGTELGSILRDQLKKSEMDQTTAALIAFADRNEHLQQKIRPALAAGKAVVSDRFTDSTYAYQGGGEGCDWGTIEKLEALVHGDLQPSLTLFFDLPSEVAAERREKRKLELAQDEKDKFDEKPIEWFEGVRNAYLARRAADPERFVTIDASVTLEEVAVQVKQAMEAFVARFSARPKGLRP